MIYIYVDRESKGVWTRWRDEGGSRALCAQVSFLTCADSCWFRCSWPQRVPPVPLLSSPARPHLPILPLLPSVLPGQCYLLLTGHIPSHSSGGSSLLISSTPSWSPSTLHTQPEVAWSRKNLLVDICRSGKPGER